MKNKTKKISDEDFHKWKHMGTAAWAIIGVIVVLAIGLYVVGILKAVIPPFLYAFIIVYFLRPVVDFFDRRGIPRVFSVILSYIIFLSVFTLIILYFIPIVFVQVNQLIKDLPDFIDVVVNRYNDVQDRFYRLVLPEGTDKVLNQISENAQKYGVRLLSGTPETITGFFGGLFNLIMGPVIAFYVLKDMAAIRTTIYGLFPERMRDEVRVVTNKVNYVVGGYLRGQALISLIVGTLIGVYFWIIGVKFAFLLGVIGGILNIIPYFGPIVAGTLAAIVAFFQAPVLALWAIIGTLIIQQIDGAFISPNIMRQAVDLHPAVIIFSLIVGGILLGFLGLILAVPIAAVAKALIMYYFYEEPEVADPVSA